MIAQANEEAVAWGEKAIALADEVGDLRTRTLALTSIGAAGVRLGSPDGFATMQDAREGRRRRPRRTGRQRGGEHRRHAPRPA